MIDRRRSARSLPGRVQPAISDDENYGTSLGPATQPLPVQALRRRPAINRESFFTPPSLPRGVVQLTPDHIDGWAKLCAAGVVFTRVGPALRPPWHAHHAALPRDFETPDDADHEDWRRLLCLNHLDGDDAREVEGWLAVPYGALPRPTLASSRYFRYARVRFIAGLTAWLQAHPPAKLWHITLVSHRFLAGEGQLGDPYWSAQRIKARWRKQLIEHELTGNASSMIAGLHAVYQRSPSIGTGYQFHYHCIADERMKPVLEKLTANEDYHDSSAATPRPKLCEQVNMIEGLATYLAKAFWTQRNAADNVRPEDRVYDGSRLGDEQQLEALRWFDRQAFADLLFTHHCNLPRYVRLPGW